MVDLEAISQALIAADGNRVNALVKQALDEGVAAKVVLNEGLIRGMDVVGERMEEGEMFIPEVLMAAKSMAAALDLLRPLLGDEEAGHSGKVAIGTVKGDLHDIGKNLVAILLSSAGFEILDLGTDVAPDKFVRAVKDNGARVVGLSALLTTTMPMMKATLDALTEAGLRERVKVIIGGAPVSQNYADEIGADGYAPDAGSASRLVKRLVA
jgi:5-methyltetrahydrofolate--homocysteine methyltransferase